MSNEPTNTTIDLAESALKKLITELLLEKAMKEAIEEVAWLALPVINPIFALVMKFAAKFLYKKAALEAAFMIIEKQTNQQNENYEREVGQLRIAIKEGRSQDEINKERAEAKERLRKLINYDAT